MVEIPSLREIGRNFKKLSVGQKTMGVGLSIAAVALINGSDYVHQNNSKITDKQLPLNSLLALGSTITILVGVDKHDKTKNKETI